MQLVVSMLYSMLLVIFCGLFIRLYVSLVIKPKKVREMLKRQGIDGPPPMILLGNILEIKKSRQAAHNAPVDHSHPPVLHNHNTAAVFPFLQQWRKQYGKLYTFSLGKVQILHVSSPEMVKEIATCTSLDLGRPSYQQKDLGPLLGHGILTSNGIVWSRQRKILAPQLFMDKIKGMMGIISESAVALVDSWKHQIEKSGCGAVELTVDGYMKQFSGDIISKACFGSSYSRGERIFIKFGALMEIISKRTMSLGIPGLRYLPTKSNRQIRVLEKEIRALILDIVKERERARDENDLVQMLVQGAKNSNLNSNAVDQFIVDNCKNIYLAGFETSAVAASWCLVLLASNPDWITRVRDEVNGICQGRLPDIDMLRKMKQLNMVIQETMRLYPPAPTLSREALKDMKIGNIVVPKGVNVWTMVATLHTDTSIWGLDALEFKPERFKNGIAGACKSPSSYMPFGFGQRVCVGQHLAMVELKMLMALILTNFSFTLSPNYIHLPVMRMLIEPKHGVQILINKL